MPRGKKRRLMCSNTLRPTTTDNGGIRRLTICHLVTLKLEWPVNEGRCPSKGCKIKLWEAAQKQNSEAAAVKRLELLINAQRRHIAHSAGEQWQPLLDYLSGQSGPLPEG